MAAMVEDRQRHPRDDMVSDLLAAEVHARRRHARAGSTSTRSWRSSRSCSSRAARRPPGSSAGPRCCSRAIPTSGRSSSPTPDLVPNAVEELLRYEAPSPIQARFVTREVEWHGHKVPQYSKIAMLTGSAGRDEREFPDADRFDVARRVRPPRHVRIRHPLLPRRQPGPPRRPRSCSRRRSPGSPSGASTRPRSRWCARRPCAGPVHVPITI